MSNIIIYVDDIVITASEKNEHERVMNELKRLYTETVRSNYCQSFEYLGMTFTVHDKILHVALPGYVNKILDEFKHTKQVDKPYTKNLFMNRDIQLLDDVEQTQMKCAKMLYWPRGYVLMYFCLLS